MSEPKIATTRTIVVIDQRQVQTPPPVGDVVAAIQKQIDRDWTPVWARPARLVVGQAPGPQDWRLYLVDRASMGFGYHTANWDGNQWQIVGYVSGGQGFTGWPITASHEVLEMLGDPLVDTCDPVPNAGHAVLQEVCDPVEDFAYRIDGGDSIPVSDFAWPSWFGLPNGPQQKYDQLSKCSNPFQIASGYIYTCQSRGDEAIIGVEFPPDQEVPPSIFRGELGQFDLMLMSPAVRERVKVWRERNRGKVVENYRIE